MWDGRRSSAWRSLRAAGRSCWRTVVLGGGIAGDTGLDAAHDRTGSGLPIWPGDGVPALDRRGRHDQPKPVHLGVLHSDGLSGGHVLIGLIAIGTLAGLAWTRASDPATMGTAESSERQARSRRAMCRSLLRTVSARDFMLPPSASRPTGTWWTPCGWSCSRRSTSGRDCDQGSGFGFGGVTPMSSRRRRRPGRCCP